MGAWLLISPMLWSPQVTSEQLVMLLELLLEEEGLSEATMRALQSTYNLQTQDAEVRLHTHAETIEHTRSNAIVSTNNKTLSSPFASQGTVSGMCNHFDAMAATIAD